MRNNRRLTEQQYPYLYGGRRHSMPTRMFLWIVSGAWCGFAAGMLIRHLITHLFQINLKEETVILIHTVTMCITVVLFTVINFLFRDKATANRNDANMQYEAAPKWKMLLKEALIMLVLDGSAAVLMWFLLQAEERAAR